MQCAVRMCGHCQFGPVFVCSDGPVFRYDRVADLMGVASCERHAERPAAPKPRRRGVQDGFLRRLSAPAARRRGGAARARRRRRHRRTSPRRRRHRPRPVRRDARRGLGFDAGAGGRSARSGRAPTLLITIGACATSGGVQALRNATAATTVRPGRVPDAGVRQLAGRLPRRSPTTFGSISSSPAARSTGASCWARWPRCCGARFHACPPRRSASSANVAASSASSSPRVSRAWAP